MAETKNNKTPSEHPGSGHRSRLRQRFLRTRLTGFHEHEILELLLTFAIPRKDVKPIARDMLSRFGSLSEVLDASGNELLQHRGAGEAAVTLIKLVRELGNYYLEQPLKEKDMAADADAVVEYLRSYMGSRDKEFFVVLFTNGSNRLLDRMVFSGTVDRAPVYIREVVERAILCHASGVIAAHNHPSGIAIPSAADIRMTRELQQSLMSLGITLLDHLIITRKNVTSLLDRRRD